MKHLLKILGLLLLSCASFAQESISSGDSISQGMRIIPPVVPLCIITSGSLPDAVQGVAYSFALQTANCASPLNFTVTSGALPTGITLNALTGVLSGASTVAGSFSFTIKVVDALGNPAIYTPSLNITSSGGGGNSIVLPPDPLLVAWNYSLAATPASGPTICVGTPANAALLPGAQCSGGLTNNYPGTQAGLQSALDNAACGQIINVANSVGFTGMTIPNNVVCSVSNWTWVTRDLSDPTFPGEGTRVDPSYAGIPQSAMPFYPFPGANPSPNSNSRHMPQLLTKASNNTPCLRLNVPSSGANTPSIAYWRLMGFECTRDQSADDTTSLIDFDYQPNGSGQDCAISGTGASGLPVNAAACAADQPHHIVLDRWVIHGDAQRQTTHGIQMGGARWVAVINNYGYDIQTSFGGNGSSDANFFTCGVGHGYTGPGWWILDNNFTASSTEGILCGGSFVEPRSPITNADGIESNVIINHHWFYKPEVWDSQRYQTTQETLPNEGILYPPVGDQEFIVSPSSIQLQQGTSFPLHNTWLNDSAGGWDHFTDASSTGSVTVDGTTYATVNSANGIIVKQGEHNVGVTPWVIGNAITYTYTACAGAGNPIAACTGATTPGAHTIVFNRIVADDGRANLANLGKDRTLTSTVTITVTSGAPTNQIALSPSAPDLQIQPSYSDGNGNKRQFGYVMFAATNFSSVSLTYKVDGITNGNSTVGQICSATAAPCAAPGSNDSSVVYMSGTGLGTHTISVTSAAGTTTSQVINVSTTSPIWAFDLKAIAEKNGFETKVIKQSQLHYSLIENAWGSNAVGGGQNGPCIGQQPINQAVGNPPLPQTIDGTGATVGYGPQIISDFAVDHVHCLHTGTGLYVASLNQSLGIHRVSYTNLWFEDQNGSRYTHGFLQPVFNDWLQLSGGTCTKTPCTNLSWTSLVNPLMDNVAFDHITETGGTPSAPGMGSWMSLANNTTIFQLGPFAVTNSVFVVPGSTTFANNQGDPLDSNTASGSGASNTEAKALGGVGYVPAKPLASTYSIQRNVLGDNTTQPLNFTSTIWQPSSTDASLFLNYNGGFNGDDRVPFGSQYDAGGARAASDGSALGADIDGIIPSDAVIRWGAPSPITITTATLPTATHGTAYSFLLTATGGTGPYVWSAPAGVVPPGAQDILDYAMMPLPDRDNFCLNGPNNPKCFKLDAGLMWWMKGFTGEPWDGEAVGPDYVKQLFTENVWLNAQSYKMYVNPVSLWARYHVPGADDVVYTPGPNKYATTTNCGLDNQPLIDNLGVRGELTGPFTDVPWQTQCIAAGGTLTTCSIPDNQPYLLAQKWIKCTANNIANCTNEEDYWLVQGYGQAKWCPKTWNGSTYVTGTCTQTMQKVAQSTVTPNFQCGVPHQLVNDAPPTGNLLTNQPPFTLGDSSGILSGTPNAIGTTKFTVQVEDSLGHIAQKTLTLVVQ